MAPPLTFRLIPDPDVHDLLTRTLERVNKACNGARTRALEARASAKSEVRTLVKEELDRFKLPVTFSTACTDRVLASLNKQKFGTYQSLVLPAAAVKWPATDRVTLPTASGKRTIRVYIPPGRGSLRPPLDGKPTALVYRNGEFELMDATGVLAASASGPVLPWERD
ncbi:MAG: hypothetical protein ACXVJ7_16150 [Acidimicrobiia bacterium]